MISSFRLLRGSSFSSDVCFCALDRGRVEIYTKILKKDFIASPLGIISRPVFTQPFLHKRVCRETQWLPQGAPLCTHPHTTGSTGNPRVYLLPHSLVYIATEFTGYHPSCGGDYIAGYVVSALLAPRKFLAYVDKVIITQ